MIPDPAVLRIIKDKGLQKQFYKDHDIPTSEFTLLENGRDLSAHEHLLPAFLKSRGGGYDGKGVMQINALSDAEQAFDGPCVLEKQINIEVELAVLVVRSDNGEVAAYDPVEMVFDPN
ncbi:MAG: ATP-grasp domain-containing protein [Flavobacteriales bacterium]|nr:ATP-grasp domain-containing protein [Flavobacteriales bacterium]